MRKRQQQWTPRTLLVTSVALLIASITGVIVSVLIGTDVFAVAVVVGVVSSAICFGRFWRARTAQQSPVVSGLSGYPVVPAGPRWWVWATTLWTPLRCGHRIWFTRALLSLSLMLTCGLIGMGLLLISSALQHQPGDTGLWLFVAGFPFILLAILNEVIFSVCVVFGSLTYLHRRWSHRHPYPATG